MSNTEVRDEPLVWTDPERMSGQPCFYGTRVPVQMLVDSLKHGETIDQFLECCVTVSREQVEAFLDLLNDRATAHPAA